MGLPKSSPDLINSFKKEFQKVFLNLMFINPGLTASIKDISSS